MSCDATVALGIEECPMPTPKMVAAGRSELAGYDSLECAAETDDVIIRVWKAMLVAASQDFWKNRVMLLPVSHSD